MILDNEKREWIHIYLCALMYSSSETYLHIHFLGIFCISKDMHLWNVVFDFLESMLETKCQVQTVERQLRIVDKVWSLNFWCYNCQVICFSLFLMHIVDGRVGIERLKLVMLTAVIDLISNRIFFSYKFYVISSTDFSFYRCLPLLSLMSRCPILGYQQYFPVNMTVRTT